MSTYTIHTHVRHHRATDWSLHHPVIATGAVVVLAVIAAALVGILLSNVFGDEPLAQQRLAGGHHARIAARHTGTAAVAAATTASETSVGATTSSVRSPARGGFAVGRTAGADDGFISSAIAGQRARQHQGFPGRSLGAGHVPSAALQRQTASR